MAVEEDQEQRQLIQLEGAVGAGFLKELRVEE